MKLLVLARNKNNFSNKRLKAEAKELGIQIKIHDPVEFDIVLSRKSPMLIRNGKIIEKFEGILPRMGASITHYGLAVLSQLEAMGKRVFNGSQATHATRNKLRCIQLMAMHDIDIPKTVIIRRPSELGAAVEAVGGFPILIKLLSGTQGVGVMLVESMRNLESTLDTLWSLGQDILIQECIHESVGRDVRVIVVGGKVIAAMRRQARIGEFRANVHRGAVVSPLDPDEHITKVALEATKIVGLDVAGVDILESHSGPKIIEINSSPGLEGIEAASKVNVARHILEYVKEASTKHG